MDLTRLKSGAEIKSMVFNSAVGPKVWSVDRFDRARERLIVASNGPKVGSVRGIREKPGKVSVRRNFLESVKKVEKIVFLFV